MALILCSNSVISDINVKVTNNSPSTMNVVAPTSHPDWQDATDWNIETGRFDTAGTPIAYALIGRVVDGGPTDYAVGGLYGDNANSANYTNGGYGFVEALPYADDDPKVVIYILDPVDLEAMINASPDFAAYRTNNDGDTIVLVGLLFCWFYDPDTPQVILGT